MKMIKRNRKNNPPSFLQSTITFPLGTLVIVTSLFYISSAYDPNWGFAWKTIRPEIRNTVKSLEDYGGIPGRAVGASGKIPQQWYRRKWLIENATFEDLLSLINYPNGVIKTTAYEGLLRKSPLDKYELMKQALNDTTYLVYYLSYPTMVGEYLAENVMPISDIMPPPPPDKTVKFNLSEEKILALRKLYHKQINKKEQYRNEQ